MKAPKYFRALLTLAFLIFAWTPASADEFYKGKTIRFIIGFSAGGGYDSYARTVARHIGKHIVGHPERSSRTWKGPAAFLPRTIFTTKSNPMGVRGEKHVAEIYSMPPKIKENLQFLMRKPITS